MTGSHIASSDLDLWLDSGAMRAGAQTLLVVIAFGLVDGYSWERMLILLVPSGSLVAREAWRHLRPRLQIWASARANSAKRERLKRRIDRAEADGNISKKDAILLREQLSQLTMLALRGDVEDLAEKLQKTPEGG